jgi:hypothetical protein
MEEFEKRIHMLDNTLADKNDGISEYLQKIREEEENEFSPSNKSNQSVKEMSGKTL